MNIRLNLRGGTMDIAIAALVLIGSLVALAGQKSGPELKPIPIESEKDKKRKN